MIRKLVLSVVALFGVATVAVIAAPQPGPTAQVSPALQGPQSTTIALAGLWSNCGNAITSVRISVKYNPAAGGAALTKDFDLTPPPAILDNTTWAFTTPVNTFAVGDVVTTTFITVYKGPPAIAGNDIASGVTPNQNLKIR